MRISLYLDEDSHSSSILIQALRYRGLDVTTAREVQMLGSTDLEQLEWATAHGCVLYSSSPDGGKPPAHARCLKSHLLGGCYWA